MDKAPLVDTIGPFPPILVYAGVLLLNLAILLVVLTALLWIGDRVEDVIFPGGHEWIDF